MAVLAATIERSLFKGGLPPVSVCILRGKFVINYAGKIN